MLSVCTVGMVHREKNVHNFDFSISGTACFVHITDFINKIFIECYKFRNIRRLTVKDGITIRRSSLLFYKGYLSDLHAGIRITMPSSPSTIRHAAINIQANTNCTISLTYRMCWIFFCILALLAVPSHQQQPAAPGPREGHCAFGYKDNYYVLGGQGDPDTSNFSTVKVPIQPNSDNTVPWNQLPTNGSHNVVYGGCEALVSGHAVILGYDPADPQTGPTPGFQTYHFKAGIWNYTPTTGDNISTAFAGRKGMATVVYDKLLIVFGGMVNGVDTQDTYVLDTTNGIDGWTWTYIPPDENTPPPSSFKDLSKAREKVYYFGLAPDANGTLNNVIYSFDPVGLKWEGKLLDLGVDFDRLQVANYKNARIFMVPTTMSTNSLGRIHSDIWELQLWNNSADVLPNSNRLSNNSVAILSNANPIFHPRVGASATCVNTTYLIIYGGSNGTRLGDLYVFDMDLKAFVYFNIPKVLPPPTSSLVTNPTIAPVIPLTTVGSSFNELGLAIGLSVAIVALLALYCFILVTLYRKRKQREEYRRSRGNNSTDPGLTEAAIATAAGLLANEDSTGPDARTWSQTLRRMILGIGRNTDGLSRRATTGKGVVPSTTTPVIPMTDDDNVESPSINNGGIGPSNTLPDESHDAIRVITDTAGPDGEPSRRRSPTQEGSIAPSSRFHEVFTTSPVRSSTAPVSAQTPTAGGYAFNEPTVEEPGSIDGASSEDSDPVKFRNSW